MDHSKDGPFFFDQTMNTQDKSKGQENWKPKNNQIKSLQSRRQLYKKLNYIKPKL